ncbi:MAG: LuxR C-terminal-related transcriptional regulator [Ktedonobacteraceae bacterium]
MPKNARYTLIWSPLHQAYELHERQGGGVRDIVSESSAWSEWVSRVSSFAFHGRSGSYTACKENKQCSEGYWYAYTRIGGKLIKRYVGKNISLTIPRLEQVAQQLWLDRPDQSLQREGIGASRLLSSSIAREGMAVPPTSIQRFQYLASRQGDNADNQKSWSESTALPIDQLLATKIHVPRPRPRIVHRPRLIQRLDQGMERVLTLISAPVGFGKSTLLSDWLASGTISVAWLSLDAQDNEPERFLSYLLAALQTCDLHLDTIRRVLHGPLQPPSMETMLTLLINDLLMQRASIQEHIVLVLDNYQVITDLSIHHALSFLLNHLPPQMHLVLATREDPPLPLAQLRGRHDVLELRAADLRFTQEEADTFLVEAMGLPLSKEESALLQARTEGWITGLQLAAISLQGREDPLAFITAFSGSNHYVVDYLLDEVLKRQSEAVQDFLLGTCILERLSAPLCDAVLRTSGSHAFLEFLERTNLFLMPLNDERDWYRYNRLFAEGLRQLLRQTAPALIPTLHLRASHWYEQQGLFIEAVYHTSAAHIPQDDPLVETLTVREREVVHLLLDGASNQEIALRLVLSVNTVKKHVLNICRKLNVRSRTHVIAKARTLPLL